MGKFQKSGKSVLWIVSDDEEKNILKEKMPNVTIIKKDEPMAQFVLSQLKDEPPLCAMSKDGVFWKECSD